MTARHKVIIYFYNRLFDPVIQSNFWLYVQDFLADPDNPYEFHVITYEDPEQPPSEEQQARVEHWTSQGLYWTPLHWHRGMGSKQKLLDVWNGFFLCLRLRLKGYRYIASLNSVAGAFAYLFARVLGLRLYMYQYEPFSEFALDNGIWNSSSRQYKIAQFLERKSAEFAHVISSGTCFMEERLARDWQVKAKFFRVPSVVNSNKFQRDHKTRKSMREKLGVEERWVLLYPGKFGDLYYKEEFAWMFRWLYEEEPRLFLLVVTPHSDEEIHELMAVAAIPRDAYAVAHCDFSEIHTYHCASDFGIISVPPGPSKKFISNIKVGEYLCAGLPYLIVRGVSEDYLYAEERGVGVVVDDFEEASIKGAWPAMREYLSSDQEILGAHCRQVGLDYRGFDSLNPRVKAAMKALVSG